MRMARYWIVLWSITACSHPVERVAPPAPPAPSAPPPVAAPGAAPAGWQLDRSTFDASVSPCADFYQHVCGGFAAKAEIPADRSRVDYEGDAAQASSDRIVQDLLAGADAAGDPEVGRLRAFYAACMTPDDATGERTLQARLAAIDAIRDRKDLQPALRTLHAEGFPILFLYTGAPDPGDPTKLRGELQQGELGAHRLYRERSKQMEQRRAAYRTYIEAMFTLAGAPAAQVRADTRAVLDIEGQLATAELTFDETFTPAMTEHPTQPAQLAQLAPHIDWPRYLELVGHPADVAVNVAAPAYVQRVDQLLATRPLAELRAFLRWRVLDELASVLPARFAAASFAFHADPGAAPPARATTCQIETMKAMGVELSRQFARRALGTAARDQAGRDAAMVQAALVEALAVTPWLSPEARAASAHKLAATVIKVGFPQTWPATGSYPVTAVLVDNALAARGFDTRLGWQRAKLRRGNGGPDDRWDNIVYPNIASGMAAARLTIANAFPDGTTNSIEFMAAFLRAPLYDAAAPLEVRLGGFGAVAGHELIHVTDDHETDAHGQPHDIWPAADGAAHVAQVGCVIRQADRYEVDGKHFEGKRTFGELDADYGGVHHAYRALAKALGPALSAPSADGTTPAQRFFIAYAQHFCQAARPEAQDAVRNDNHGPVQFRVNGPLSNLPGFAEAFGCAAGSAMARPASDRCTVW